MKANAEFCDHCGEPADPLPGDTETDTCENCGWPIDGGDPEPENRAEAHDDPYVF